jgi:hypothetical protein
MTMRVQSIVNTNDGLQLTYILEADIHEQSGIMTARTVDIPHAVLPQHLLDELVDIAHQIIDHARVVQREPEEQFRAQR